MLIMAGRATEGPLARAVAPRLKKADRGESREDVVIRADLSRGELMGEAMAFAARLDLLLRVAADAEPHAQFLGRGAGTGLVHVRAPRAVASLARDVGDHRRHVDLARPARRSPRRVAV